MTTITLDDHEMIMVRMVGLMRHHANTAAKVPETKRSKMSGEDIHADGFMAEYAFGKWKNLFVDLSTLMRSGGYDLRDKNFRFDIKSNRLKNPDLIIVMKDNPDVDIYILSRIEGNQVHFLGWCEKHEAIREEYITDLGYGPLYRIPREKLRPL